MHQLPFHHPSPCPDTELKILKDYPTFLVCPIEIDSFCMRRQLQEIDCGNQQSAQKGSHRAAIKTPPHFISKWRNSLKLEWHLKYIERWKYSDTWAIYLIHHTKSVVQMNITGNKMWWVLSGWGKSQCLNIFRVSRLTKGCSSPVDQPVVRHVILKRHGFLWTSPNWLPSLIKCSFF